MPTPEARTARQLAAERHACAQLAEAATVLERATNALLAWLSNNPTQPPEDLQMDAVRGLARVRAALRGLPTHD